MTARAHALVGGVVFGLVATLGLVEERLGHGSRAGMWLGAVTMVCVVQLFASVRAASGGPTARAWTEIHATQLLGATIGVLAVHSVLAAKLVVSDPLLVECPAQLVNDAVLVGCVLALVWAVVARALWLRVVWFAVALVPCFSYLSTTVYWHCDHFTGYPVQHYVASQLTAAFDAAVALLVYMAATRRAAK